MNEKRKSQLRQEVEKLYFEIFEDGDESFRLWATEHTLGAALADERISAAEWRYATGQLAARAA